jgi:hypothetical protein
MHEGRIIRHEIGPEQLILELKLHRPRENTIAFGHDEQTCIDLRRNAIARELSFHPHRRPVVPLHPCCGFAENGRNHGRIVRRGLSDEDVHKMPSRFGRPERW